MDEWAGQPQPPDFRADHAPFNEYAYFAELYTGWYEPGGDDQPGAWHIAERKRRGDDEQRLRLTYDADPGAPTHWQQCGRRTDRSLQAAQTLHGLDLAGAPAQGDFGGMLHHSQFKCVVVADEADPTHPLRVPAATVDAQYALNRCVMAGIGEEQDPAAPTHRFHECQLLQGPQPGDIGIGAVRYVHYRPNAEHTLELVRGRQWSVRYPGDPPLFPLAIQTQAPNPLGTVPVTQLAFSLREDDRTAEVKIAYDFSYPRHVMDCPGTPEVCDGLDTDCDGQVDDGVRNAEVTALVCPVDEDLNPRTAGLCADSLPVCRGREGWECEFIGGFGFGPQPRYEADELSCDDRDNDCDGEVDEARVPCESTCGPGTRTCVQGSDCQAPCRAECGWGLAVCLPGADQFGPECVCPAAD